MNMKKKDLYDAPTILIVEVKTEGIICVSGDVDATMDGTWTEETI